MWHLLSSLVLLTAVGGANAASVTFETKAAPEYGESCIVSHVVLDGDIVKGDFARIKEAFAKAESAANDKESSCAVNESGDTTLKYISLNSNGGNYLEALDILDWMTGDNRTVSTFVDDRSVCYSACAIIFLGGSVPAVEERNALRRSIGPKAKLGFHAPFPVLEDRKYSDIEVMDYFHTAFFIEHDFFNRAKKVGLPVEVAQLLMQPTNDSFYLVDTVGRSFLLSVTVQSMFTFSSPVERPYKIEGDTAINICINNELISTNGDATEFLKFYKWLQDNKLKATSHFTASKTNSGVTRPDLASVVPVEYSGEGMYQSCVVSIPLVDEMQQYTESAVPKCFGIFDDDFELGNRIERDGVDSLAGGDKSFCRADGPLAGLPFNKRLSDLTTAELGE